MSRLGRALDGAGWPYVVIGGQAVIMHGHVRVTRDVDFTLHAPLGTLAELIAWRDEVGLVPRGPGTDDIARVSQVLPCLDPDTGMGVDFSLVDSPYLDQARERGPVVEVDGYPVRFLHINDLIIHKVIAGRAQDQIDVVELLNYGHEVDHGEVNRWLEQFEQVVEEELRERYAAWRREAEV